jgi:aspartate racemase
MNFEKEIVIGVVGGMGPQAGLALCNSILCQTNARTDQEHLPVILMSFPGAVEDRTLFLQGAVADNPAFAIAGIIQKLEKAGAGIIGIACNTSHSPEIYDVILHELKKRRSRVKLVNMPYETCRHIQDTYPSVRRVGLLTTNGTWQSGIYKKLLREAGLEPVIPDYQFQQNVIHKMIYDPDFGIKANPAAVSEKVRTLLDKALHYLKEQGAEAIIVGCTELSLVLPDKMIMDMIIVDSTGTLAGALVREATRKEMKKSLC